MNLHEITGPEALKKVPAENLNELRGRGPRFGGFL